MDDLVAFKHNYDSTWMRVTQDRRTRFWRPISYMIMMNSERDVDSDDIGEMLVFFALRINAHLEFKLNSIPAYDNVKSPKCQSPCALTNTVVLKCYRGY